MSQKSTSNMMETHRREWQDKKYDQSVKRFGERKDKFETESGIKIDPLYAPDNISHLDYFQDIGFPGEYPFTRGPYNIGYRSRYWQANQYCGFGTAEETNKRLMLALSHGEGGLNVIMDLPTSYHGIDADDPRAEGEVGKTGVSCNSIEDMHDLFKGISIDKVSVTFNTTGLVVLAMYFAMAKERGIELTTLWGTALNNPLSSYVSCNSGVLPAPKDALRELTDIVEFTTQYAPKWHPLNIGGYEYRENGASAVQEMAFMFGNAIAYTNAFISRGLDFDRVATKYVFYTSMKSNLIEEIAKLRAARKIWAKIAQDRFKTKNQDSMRLRIHTQTSGLTLTAEQPLNNIIRTTIQSLAAVLGGTNSLYTDSYDEALCIPSEEGLRTAMRVQQIIMEESGVADTIDPLGGSYYLEYLTNQIENRVFEIVKQIDEMGGMVAAIEKGWVQSEIEQTVIENMAKVSKGDSVVVGYNKYQTDDPVDHGIFTVDPAYELKQKERLSHLKAKRDKSMVENALNELRAATREHKNVMIPCMNAAHARATFGEMTAAIYGEMQPYKEQFLKMKLQMRA